MKAIDALALAGTNIVCSSTKGQNWGDLDANHSNETDEARGAEGERHPESAMLGRVGNCSGGIF